MTPVSADRTFMNNVRTERCTHVVCLSFEDRCIGYPQVLAHAKARGHDHTFLCIMPSNDGVGGELQRRRTTHKGTMTEILPAMSLEPLAEVKRRLKAIATPMSFYLDVSAMPRLALITTLSTLVHLSDSSTRLFIIHTDPEEYYHGALQTPGPEMSLVFDEPIPSQGQSFRALMFPGFDLPYSIVALTYLSGLSGKRPNLKWYFSYPGRKYAFYQRARETHAHLVEHGEFGLYPQYHIGLSFERLKADISQSECTVLVPLGPRITCVSIFFAAVWARNKNIKTNIVLPTTLKYSSLRSTGHAEPMIEDVTPILQACKG